ncbi:alpha/beta hydrolase [Nocardioides sp. BP30]|uniref:alpha/beta hydrolase n=1 Tax=Nocardioides sp. BP30 TaxID=3036374 RepID=UPI0024695594|nr:alpha/beta hydrolase [Nocardioides sp. BP30]WGL52022.1 alpha/beta hydrolase [Nocardioides sp. BP30]
MTTSVIAISPAAWDEPEGIAARGTLVVLTGRGETPGSYQRLGRRISADAYRVRVLETDLDDLDRTRDAVRSVLADETLPAPRVLVGSDTGATFAAILAAELDSVDGLVLAGLALPGSSTFEGGWEEELGARTACPTHRRVIGEDDAFERGALARPLPEEWDGRYLPAPEQPTLVLHGSADPITDPGEAFEAFADAPLAQLRRVVGAHHDVLNDVSHRSVAATVVLFLESLKLGSDLPVIVERIEA